MPSRAVEGRGPVSPPQPAFFEARCQSHAMGGTYLKRQLVRGVFTTLRSDRMTSTETAPVLQPASA